MIDQIRPNQLDAWFQAQDNSPVVVLDVREPWEVNVANVPASGLSVMTIPMGEIPQRLNELDPTAPIACLCHHGMRSLRVAMFLSSQGFGRVANIAGGINAWSAERDASVPVY